MRTRFIGKLPAPARLRRVDQQPGSLSAPLEFLRVAAIEQVARAGNLCGAVAPVVGLRGRAVEIRQRAASDAPDMAGLSGGTAHYFHTPFNRISRYREPGRINLNTLTSSDVLFGAMNMYLPALAAELPDESDILGQVRSQPPRRRPSLARRPANPYSRR